MVAITRIDIDDEALRAAIRLSGARTPKDMVNLALREYVARRTRGEARLRHFAVAQNWDDQGFWRRHADEKNTG